MAVETRCLKSKWSDESSYGAVQGDTLDTNKTMRFFYVNSTSNGFITAGYDVYDTSTMTPSALLIIPQKECSNFLLDYDYTNSGGKKTITSVFFNIQVQSGYEIEVPVCLPNEVYKQINSGTLVKFNDGIYKVSKIDEHDVKEEEKATITLITLT